MRKKKWKRVAFYSCRALLRWAVIMIGTLTSVSLAVYVLENQNSRMVLYIAAGLAAALYIGNLFYERGGSMRDKLWGVYPNLERWILLNCRSIAEFARRVSVDVRTVRRILSAECGTTKSVIDRILKVTGMTYEKCFKEEQ